MISTDPEMRDRRSEDSYFRRRLPIKREDQAKADGFGGSSKKLLRSERQNERRLRLILFVIFIK